MKSMTLVFLLDARDRRICLAMKKLGFGMGRWNGAGGKVEKGETVEEAMRREAFEEIGVAPKKYEKVAELSFSFPDDPSWDQAVHTFICTQWEGEPAESDEMAPRWFDIQKIPYKKMWPDDAHWLPLVLEGKKVRAAFSLGKGDKILSKDVKTVETL